jgi:hypothetical protein
MRLDRLCAVAVVALVSVAPVAQAEDSPVVVICNVITDRAVELVRAGELAKARAMKPQLEKCNSLLQTELNSAVKKVLEETTATAPPR